MENKKLRPSDFLGEYLTNHAAQIAAVQLVFESPDGEVTQRKHRLIAFSNGAAYNIIADEYVTSYHIGVKRVGWALPCLIDHIVKKKDMHGLSLSDWCDKYLWKELE